MDKKPKYEIGQKVWYMQYNKPTEGMVTGIFASYSPNMRNVLEYSYYFDSKFTEYSYTRLLREVFVFPSKEDLIKSL